jgi:fatty-acyl-CoA synthase
MSHTTSPSRTGTWFGAHVLESAHEAEDKAALVFADQCWSYGDLDRAVRGTLRGLDRAGVRRGDRVVMSGAARPEAVITMLAVTRMGAVLVPLHPHVTNSELAHVCAETLPAAVVADAPFWETRAAEVPDELARLSWDRADGAVLRLHCDDDMGETDVVIDPPRGEDIAIVAFTSGTSGRAKGVALSHDNLHWSMVNGLARLDVRPDDVTLIATPLAHVAVLGGLPQYTWARRGTVVLAPRFHPDLFLDLVRDHRATLAFAVPAMLTLLGRHPRFDEPDLETLRWVLAGGSPAIVTTTQRWLDRGVRVVNSYGSTESSAGVTYASPEDVSQRPASAGLPVPHVELRIASGTGASLPPNSVGELWLRGPSVASSYWTRAGLQPVTRADGWFRTGDRGRLDDDGRLEVVGRVKDTIITGGENVDPVEVEEVLRGMPGLQEVAVVGTPDPVWGEVVTAFLVTDGTDAPSVADLRDHLDGKIARHKWPRVVHQVTALPRGATGKLQRHRLPGTHQNQPDAGLSGDASSTRSKEKS